MKNSKHLIKTANNEIEKIIAYVKEHEEALVSLNDSSLFIYSNNGKDVEIDIASTVYTCIYEGLGYDSLIVELIDYSGYLSKDKLTHIVNVQGSGCSSDFIAIIKQDILILIDDLSNYITNNLEHVVIEYEKSKAFQMN